MLTLMRKFTKSWVAFLLFGLIIISFAAFGLSDVSRWGAGKADSVAQVGKAHISMAEYADTFKRALERVTEQAGRPVTTQEAVAEGVDQQLLQQLVDETTALEIARKLGLVASDAQVATELKGIPAFRDPIKEAFDAETYKRVLAENGLTPTYFEGRLRDDIIRRQLLSALAMGLQAPKSYGDRRAAFLYETRTADYVIVDPRLTGAPPEPKDSDLQTFLKAQAERFQSPERRSLSYARFKIADDLAKVEVPESELKALYDFRKDKLGTPEKRQLAVWVVPNAEVGAALVKRLQAKEKPDAIVKAMKLATPVTYDQAIQAQMADAVLAKAAFLAEANSVIGPIKGDLGLAVVQVGAISTGEVVAYDAIRGVLREEVAKGKAADMLFERVQAFQDARDKGATLEEAASKIGVKLETLKNIDAQGRLPNGQPSALTAERPELIQEAFTQAAKVESDMRDVKGGGEYFVVRVDTIEAAKLPPLDEVRGPLTQIWRSEKLREILDAKAAEIVKKIEAGQPLATVAKSYNLPVRKVDGLRRVDAAGKPVPPLLQSLFAAQKGMVVSGAAGGFAIGVAQVTAVTPPDPKILAGLNDNERGQLDFALAGDMGQQFMAGARQALKVRLHPDRAAKAIGVEPAKDDAAKQDTAKTESAKK